MRNRLYWFLFIALVVVIADELAYYWWRNLNPGAIWGVQKGKNLLQTWDGEPQNTYPNGYRPGGGL